MSLPVLPAPALNILSKKNTLVAALKKQAPKAKWILDLEGQKAFETDATTVYSQMPLAVVLPTTTEEVSQILKYCHEQEIKVLARGAGTSLCGGALPAADAVVIGLSRMNKILDLDYSNRTATLQAGVTNQAISDAMRQENFFYAPDPFSQLACSIGGNIAMNAGGRRALKYGVTSNHILSVKIVMMDGQVIDFGGKWMEASGYDFLALIVGSEGQLGIVTEAIVRITKRPESVRPMLIGFGSVQNAGECAASIISNGILPTAMEFMDKAAIKACETHIHAGYPTEAEALLIVEVEGSDAEIDEQFEQLRNIAKLFAPTLFREAQTSEESEVIWSGWKGIFGAMGKISDYYCTDGVVPLSSLPEVLPKIQTICDRYKLRVSSIFHAIDGNLNAFILYNANDEEELLKARECSMDVLKLCVEYGGCLSGEYGIGIEKRDLMPIQFTRQDLEQQMAIKTIFDPKWLLNPAKLFPLTGRPVAPAQETEQE